MPETHGTSSPIQAGASKRKSSPPRIRTSVPPQLYALTEEQARLQAQLGFEKFYQTPEGQQILDKLAAAHAKTAMTAEAAKLREENANIQEQLKKLSAPVVPTQMSDDDRAQWMITLDILRDVGRYKEAAWLEKAKLGTGTGEYVLSFSNRAKAFWNTPLKVKNVVIGGAILLAAIRIYETIAANAGWPSFEILVPRPMAVTEGAGEGTMTRSEAGARGGRASGGGR